MLANILVILTLFFLEVMLSIDNVAVLAIMVKDLPSDQSNKALKYGLVGAYVIRGLCLCVAGWLVHLWGLKILGGVYLVYLTYGFFTPKDDTLQEDLSLGRDKSKIYQWLRRNTGLSDLIMTIILVECMDLTFSLDNIFAAVAMSPHLWIVIVGVFCGMAAMRFVAQGFVSLLNKYPFLEKSAFIVIGLLGLKLILNGLSQGLGLTNLSAIMDKHSTDMIFSGLMMLIFLIPLALTYAKDNYLRSDETGGS